MDITNIPPKEFDKAIKLKIWDKVAVSNWRPFEEFKINPPKQNEVVNPEFQINQM